MVSTGLNDSQLRAEAPLASLKSGTPSTANDFEQAEQYPGFMLGMSQPQHLTA